jgi:acetolactate synthase-1/2/3 large subunit
MTTPLSGGDLVAAVLKAQGVTTLFTLVGGHISPILTGARKQGLRVIDTRHEATAVFAADAVGRLTGIPGVAVVTAGPGVTNTVTAVKNAAMAQSPVLVLGGAAATILRGRGALQDIDQLALFRPLVKQAVRVNRVRDIVPTLEQAFRVALEGVPGPVFVELPIDLLYSEPLVQEMYGSKRQGGGVMARLQQHYLAWHVRRLFRGGQARQPGPRLQVPVAEAESKAVQKGVRALQSAEKPLLLLGSQALLDIPAIPDLVAAIERLGIPVWLSGMARGLLGKGHPLQMRHKRRQALREADCVILAGVPADFRLDYGNHVRRSATLIGVNRSRADLRLNRRPDIGAPGDPSRFVRALADGMAARPAWGAWVAHLRARDGEREGEIGRKSLEPTALVNPLHCLATLESQLAPDTILIADGGDFVATASYILNPRGPLTWLDPGPFGTLGCGAGFALGAHVARPAADIWILYGDGSCGYSVIEFDTFVRHHIPVTALVGNDASWAQIAREQVPLLGDPVATELARTPYDEVAIALGGGGLTLSDPELVPEVLARAQAQTRAGVPTLVNVQIGRTDFREGSLSM